MGNVAKYQHGWNMTFTVVELLMIIPKSTYLSISLPYFSIYHFFSLTLYDNKKSRETITSSIKEIKKKLQIGNIDFTRGNIFIVELLGGKIYEDPEEWCEGFGIIEIGFSTEQQAVDIFKKAKIASQKYTMNIPIYRPPFRCVRVGKSVLFVYSINVNMDKYLDLVESWQPLKCE